MKELGRYCRSQVPNPTARFTHVRNLPQAWNYSDTFKLGAGRELRSYHYRKRQVRDETKARVPATPGRCRTWNRGKPRATCFLCREERGERTILLSPVSLPGQHSLEAKSCQFTGRINLKRRKLRSPLTLLPPDEQKQRTIPYIFFL